MPRRSGSFDKECKVHGITSHYIASDKQERCRKCRNTGFTNRRKNLKVRAILYKGGSCIKCGYSECIEAMEFHHLDPAQKDSRIAKTITAQTWDKIVIELDKCIMVCANCHRKIHSELLGAPKLADLLSEEAVEQREAYNKVRELDPNRNVLWIEKDKLEVLLWQKSMIDIAEEYGVSDSAITFWAKSYGLEKPSRGYWISKNRKKTEVSPIDEKRLLESLIVSSGTAKQRKVTRPSHEELKKLLLEMPAEHIGKMYSVSGTTIAKWAKSYGITKPARGYWQKIAAKTIKQK